MSKAPPKRKTRPTVSIVGAGRLGTAMAIALSSLDYRIQAVVARRSARAKKAASLISRTTAALGADKLRQLPLSQIILITTPDDEIAPTAEKLAGLPGNSFRGRVVLHTSGALSSEVLAPLVRMGNHAGSLHPLVSVSDPRTGAENLRGAFYCVEGDTAAVRAARRIVSDLKGESFSIPSDRKPLYHAAAVMASGHVVALFDLAIEMLVQCGLSAATARRVLLPLLQSTVNNLLKAVPARALTGTFARADLTTVLRHLEALSKDGSSRVVDAYRALGIHALDLAEENGAEPRILREIRKVLEPHVDG